MAKIRETGKRIITSDEPEKEKNVEISITSPQLTLNHFINNIEVEEEISYKNLKIFPIHVKQIDLRTVKLKTLDEALKEGILEIKETSVIAELKFINKSKTDKILIVEGDVVQGGKQNRVVNVTMIIDEDSTVTVPTSCVEARRWDSGMVFVQDTNKLSPTVYSNLAESVHDNMKETKRSEKMSYCSDQTEVWSTVSAFLTASSSSSSSSSYSDTYKCREEDMNDYLDKILPHIKKCNGLAAIVQDTISVYVCDSEELFEPQLKNLLKSYIIEALTVEESSNLIVNDIVKTINDLLINQFEIFDSPNKTGSIMKFVSPYIGSAFLYKDNIVHLTFVKK